MQKQDEDTRQVLNAMSHPAQVDRLTFYMLPSSWMNACLSFLMGQTSQRPILKIENASLLSSGQVSDEEAEEETFYESRGRNAQKSTQKSITLRRDLVHRSDFFCVGSNVWNLVSEKFGFDEELAYKVVSKGQGLLAVNFGIGTPEVPIPATGHFDYRSVAAQPTDVVSDEEDDDLVSQSLSVMNDRTLMMDFLVLIMWFPVSGTFRALIATPRSSAAR